MEFASKLQQARVARRWTVAYVAEQIDVQRSTVSRWEDGHESPQLRYVAALEKLFGMTASELGLEEALLPRQQKPWKPAGVVRDVVKGNLLLRVQVLIVTAGVTYQELARLRSCIVQELERPGTMNEGISRREAVRLLATLPILTFKLSITEASALTSLPTEEFLKHCAAGIVACEQLAKGDASDLALAGSALSRYLPTLKELVKQPGRYSKHAASLTAQAFMRKAMLAAHRKNDWQVVNYAQEAVSYGEESGDAALHIATLARLAWAYFNNKDYKHASEKALQARYLLEQAKQPLSALLISGVYASSARYQALRSKPEDIPLLLGKAHESFVPAPAIADELLHFVDFSSDILTLDEGQARYFSGQPEVALTALNNVIDLDNEDFALKMPVSSKRVHTEIINYALLASMKLPGQQKDKERSIALCDAGLDGAIVLQSEPRLSEIGGALDMMECAWPDDRRVRDLREKATRGWGKPDEEGASV